MIDWDGKDGANWANFELKHAAVLVDGSVGLICRWISSCMLVSRTVFGY